MATHYSDPAHVPLAERIARQEYRNMMRDLRPVVTNAQELRAHTARHFGFPRALKDQTADKLVPKHLASAAKAIVNAYRYAIGPAELDHLIQESEQFSLTNVPQLSVKDLPTRTGILYLPEEVAIRIGEDSHQSLRALRWQPSIMPLQPGEDPADAEPTAGVWLNLYADHPSVLDRPDRRSHIDSLSEELSIPAPPWIHVGSIYLPFDRPLSNLVAGSDEWIELVKVNKKNKTEDLGTVGLENLKDKLSTNFRGRVIKDPAYVFPMRLLLAMTQSVRGKTFSVARFDMGPSNSSQQDGSARDRVLYLPRAQPELAASQGRLVGRHTGVEYVRAHEVSHPSSPHIREEHLRFVEPDEQKHARLRAQYLDDATGQPSVSRFFEVNPELVRYRWTKAQVAEFGPPVADRALTGLHRVRAARAAVSAEAPLQAAAAVPEHEATKATQSAIAEQVMSEAEPDVPARRATATTLNEPLGMPQFSISEGKPRPRR